MERKTEYVLTLIGAILNALLSAFFLIVTIFMGLAYTTVNSYNQYSTGDDYYYDSYSGTSGFEDKAVIIFLGVMVVWFIAITVFGFIAAFKIKKNLQGWGIATLVLGILSIASIQGILWVIAGIMMLSRKTPAPIKSLNGETSTSLLEDVEQLKKLRDEGIISEEEYQAKRNEWIDF